MLQRHHHHFFLRHADQIPGRLIGDQLAMVDDGDPVAQLFGFLQIMGGQHHGHAALVELGHIFPQLLAQFDVHTGRRLVQDDDRRRMHHGLRYKEPPLHAAGQGARIGLRLVLQMHRAQQRVGLAFCLGHAVQPGLQIQRLARREEGIEHDLLRHDTDRRLGVARIFVDVEAPDAGMARRLVDQPRQDVDQRGLARAIGAEQPEDQPPLDIEADIVERLLAPGIGFGKMADRDGGV